MAGLSFQGNFATLSLGMRLLLLVLIVSVISAVYYLTIQMNLAGEIDQARADTQRLQATLREAQVRQQTYLALREELASRESLDRQYLRVLPAKSEIAAFLGDLDRLTELSGLQVEEVQPKPEIKEEFFTKVPVELGLSGKYHQLAKFFYNVSLLERAVNMENVTLSKPQQVGEDIILQVGVLATTFRRQE
ncbi:MAG: type 4a pilus biogenesis protein PilO [Deltaproteobacteria bacterium]|nr:type 4a pilus biogenesis protein PilO [Deltaproteobacteria bacterium]